MLPNAFDPAWERDGILEQPPPGKSKGKKAWWIKQMLGMVPPSVWTQRWSVTPDDLLAAAIQSEWEKLLLSAWTEATRRHSDPVWAEALLTIPTALLPDLWMLLPRTRREAVFVTRLARLADPSARLDFLTQLVGFTEPWSEAFSVAIAKTIHGLIERIPTYPGYHLHTLFQACAFTMAPRTAETVERLWITSSQSDSGWSKVVAETLDTLRFRSACLQAIV